MRMRFEIQRLCLVAFLSHGLPAIAQVAWAENDGQADLDRALEMKLSVYTQARSGKVIDLCQTALDKGLDQENQTFCKQLLVETLLRRAERAAGIGDNLVVTFNKPPQPSAADWQAAIQDVERAGNIDPAQPAVQLMMAKLQMLREGDHAKARQALDEALRMTDDAKVKVEALRLRAGLHDKFEERLKDLSDAIELAPNDVALLRQRGESYLRRNKSEQALADFDAAIKLARYDLSLEVNRALALEALKRYREARDSYSRLVKSIPGQVAPLLYRARMTAMAGDHLLVIEDANRVLAIDPNQPMALQLRGQALFQLGRFGEALPDVDRAIALQPESAYAIWLWATIVAKLGRSNFAIKTLRQQVEAKPDDSVAWLQLALLYSGQRRMGKAIDAYTAVVELGQHRSFAYQQRGDIYLNMGMHQEAIDDYDNALKFDANNSTASNNLAWVLATSFQAELRDGKRALELALKACELTSYQQAFALSTLAAAYAECGDFKTARTWSQKSLELADDSIKDHCRLELASYEKEQPWRESQGRPESAD